jgi:hypothetical protein
MPAFVAPSLRTKNCFITPWRQRAGVFGMCLIFCSTILFPPISAYAASTDGEPHYAGALPTGKSNITLAADTGSAADGKATTPTYGDDTGPTAKQKNKHQEIVSKRTANTETFDLGNGKLEVRQYMQRVHYKVDGKWEKIDTSLVQDDNAADSNNVLGEALAWVKSKTQDLHTYKTKANDWQARFAASDDPVGMVRIEAGGKKIGFTPRNVSQGVTPLIKTSDGMQTVIYKDLWPGTDVIYTVKHDMLKEEIMLKDKNATTNLAFDVTGAGLVKNRDGGFDIAGSKQQFTELSVTLQKAGPISEPVINQDFKNGVLTITLDQSWLKQQAADQFPVVIDPTYRDGSNVGYGYQTFKSDGYVCSSSACFMNAGEMSDSSWKNWRTVYCTGDISFMAGKRVTYAGMYLRQANRSYLAGYSGGRIFWSQHAASFGYWGMDSGAPSTAAVIDYAGTLDTTNLVQFEVDRSDWGPCWSLWGEETAGYGSYKGFDPDLSYMHYEYSTTPAAPNVVTPQNEQTFVDPQVSFQINPVSDVDGDPVQYYYRIATGADGESGTLINSGDVSSTQWTVPDGVLQDGGTYYLHVYSRDPYGYSAPTQAIKFKIDSRRGKDKTQTYDTVGSVSIDLTNGNVSTSTSSHDTSALGGSLGISLDYNSPMRSRQGLVGSYWNNTNQNGGPMVTRVDRNIDFNWDQGSPSAAVINADNFSARWDGYFVAPARGMYYIGGTYDDTFRIYVNNQMVMDNASWTGTPAYGGGVALEAGQIVPLRVEATEYGGNANAHLYVKGAVNEQIVPKEWLQTGARPISQPHGLTGSYYTNGSGYNLDGSDKQLIVRRIDPMLNFQWGGSGPVPDVAADFMTRWSGYVTLADNNYTFGTTADDGARITIGSMVVADNYSGPCCIERYGATTHFSAGVYPIQIDYYDSGGGASFAAKVKVGSDAIGQIIPTDWLSPSAQVLPSGWQLGIDPDGDLSYDHLTASSSSVTLSDSTGDTHNYTWTGSGYKPPINEDGQLTHGGDGKYTLIDTDGRTYVFKPDGTLESVTNPTDDRKSAALKYTYGTGQSSTDTAPRILQITDGIDSGRYAKVYYSGDGQNMCAASPDSAYLDPADPTINGYICGVQTNDGRTSSFYYANFTGTVQLALMVKPGNEHISYTKEHLTGDSEPNGYTRRVDYDNIFRTTIDTDVTGNATTQVWDAVKDLLLSSTDATGLKSTTVYDSDDRPIDSYGPAPSTWFGADNKPLAANLSQTPHTSTGYDEGITGAAVSWYGASNATGSLTGAPVDHITGISPADPSWLGRNFTTAPIAANYNVGTDYGFTATGKIAFPQAGVYSFRVWHDDGVRLYIDDQSVVDDWGYRSEGAVQNSPSGTFTAEAGKLYRFKFDYVHLGNPGALEMWIAGPGITDASNGLGTNHPTFLKPDYSLETSQTVYGAPTINGQTATLTSTTNYGSTPEYGLAQSASTDSTGLALTAASAYEVPGTGYLRQTSSSLPGGATTNYAYYGATDTADNPCTVGTTEAFRQGGMLRLKSEPAPGGAAQVASAVPVVRASNSGSVSSGSLTLTKPTGTVNGNLLVMTASADLSAAQNVSFTPPNGWTSLLPLTRSDAASAGTNLQIWYKIANNEPASYAIAPSMNKLFTGAIVRIDGQSSTNPISVSNVTASATGEAATPSVNTTVANSLVLGIATWDGSKTIVSAPSGLANTYYVHPSGRDEWGGYKSQATPGNTGTAQFDLSSGSPYVGFSVAVQAIPMHLLTPPPVPMTLGATLLAGTARSATKSSSTTSTTV